MRDGSPTDVAIVGAGPYGMALAAHLQDRGVGFRIFGRPMESWLRHMPKGMYLKSEGDASSIPDPRGRFTLASFCREFGREYADSGVPVSIETFSDYGLWFQEQVVPNLEEAEVGRVERVGDEFEVSLSTGEALRARRVVAAVGHVNYRYTPPELRELPEGSVSHSADHRDFSRLAGKEIAVIGRGQSALETAALLHEQGASPRVIVRKPSILWIGPPNSRPSSLIALVPRPNSGIGVGWRTWVYAEMPRAFFSLPEAVRVRLAQEVLGPSGAWWLRDRVEQNVALLFGHSVRSATAEDGKVRLHLAVDGRDGNDLVVDHVIAGTGYRVDVERLPFLDRELTSSLRHVGGSPVLSPYFESSEPGLYFIGLTAANSYGPVMRFVYGSRFAARRVTKHVARGA